MLILKNLVNPVYVLLAYQAQLKPFIAIIVVWRWRLQASVSALRVCGLSAIFFQSLRKVATEALMFARAASSVTLLATQLS